jgi:membrane-associated phospholipid phosphatase
MSETSSLGLARAHPIPWVFDARIRLSLAEQIALAFFAYIIVAAIAFHLAARDLATIIWLLDHYSVQACIFPSGHVAAATAVALAVRKHAPRLGALFLFLAASVALATVYGRYHYAADAVAGALVGVAAFIASNAIKHRAVE